MSSITLESRAKNRKLPNVDVPIVERNDEFRRFSESVKEHLRMYEGDSGAPKERFVTIEELEHVGLVTTKVQGGFASIDKIFGEQIAPVPSALPTAGTPGGDGGVGGGVRTLRELDDTAVSGIDGGQGIVFDGNAYVPKEFPNFSLKEATRYDMLFFDGEDWTHTKQELQWNPDDDYLQLANDHSINWLDTSGVTQDFVNFATLTGGAPGAAVGHVISKLTAGVTTTSATYVDVTGATAAFASLEANKDYAVFVRAYVGNSTSTTTAQNKVRLTKGGTLVTGSEHIYESPGVTIDSIGMLYYWGGIIASGASGDLQLQHLSGNGSDTVFANNVTIMMIKVDDLILNTNIFHDTDTSLVELDDGDFPPVFFATGAGITIGDGASDYLVFGSIRVQDFLTGGNQVEMRVNDGSTTKSGSEVGRGDSSDQLTMGFMQLWQAPASSTTLSVEARGTGFPVDKVYASIIAIRLSAFADYNSAFLATSPDLGAGPTDIVTLAFTTALTGDYGFISGATGPNSGATGVSDFIRNDLNGGGDVTIAGSATQLGIANIVVGTTDQPHWGVSADQSLTASDTVDADLRATDATTPTTWTNNFLVAFRWALSGDAEFFDVGNVGFTTRMKGLRTRFFDPGLTDFVEFEHDGTDFNLTGFQTADINIIDMRLVTDASATDQAGFNIPTGVAPTSPAQGDIWVTATDIFARLNGVDESLLFVNTENIIGTLEDTLDFFNGAAIEIPDVSVTSNGTVITFSIEKVGGGDVRHVFSDGVHTQDATPPDTITLTAGTDTVPVLNFLYVLQSTKVLTVSTVSFPATEHTRLATVLCQSAASLQTDGAYKLHAWTDELFGSGISHLQDINFWIRSQAASWISGALATPTLGVTTFDVAVSTGSVLQLHPQTYPAFDTSTGSEVMIVNDSVTAFKRVGDLTGELTDALGGSMSNKFYNLVFWGVVSEDAVDSQLMVNLPVGVYNNAASAILDADETSVFNIPADFIGVGFLIACLTVRHQPAAGGTFTLIENVDLRGLLPSISAAGVAGGGVSAFGELSDVDLTGALDNDILHRVAGIWVPTAGASWTLETASFTLVASDRKNVEATAAATTATVAATIAAGDEFIIHNQTTSTKVVDIEPNTGHTIKGPGGDVVGGTDTLVLATGDTVRLVAVSTSVLEIV